MARAAHPDSGVYMVPAFTGLGAPLDRDARAAFMALAMTAACRSHANPIAHQTRDLFEAMAADGAAALRRFGSMADSYGTIGRCSLPIVGGSGGTTGRNETTASARRTWRAYRPACTRTPVRSVKIESGKRFDPNMTEPDRAKNTKTGLMRCRERVQTNDPKHGIRIPDIKLQMKFSNKLINEMDQFILSHSRNPRSAGEATLRGLSGWRNASIFHPR